MNKAWLHKSILLKTYYCSWIIDPNTNWWYWTDKVFFDLNFLPFWKHRPSLAHITIDHSVLFGSWPFSLVHNLKPRSGIWKVTYTISLNWVHCWWLCLRDRHKARFICIVGSGDLVSVFNNRDKSSRDFEESVFYNRVLKKFPLLNQTDY